MNIAIRKDDTTNKIYVDPAFLGGARVDASNKLYLDPDLSVGIVTTTGNRLIVKANAYTHPISFSTIPLLNFVKNSVFRKTLSFASSNRPFIIRSVGKVLFSTGNSSMKLIRSVSLILKLYSSSSVTISRSIKLNKLLEIVSSGQSSLKRMMVLTLSFTSTNSFGFSKALNVSKIIFVSSPHNMIINRVQPLLIFISSTSSVFLDDIRAQLIEIFFRSGSSFGIKKHITKTLRVKSVNNINLSKLTSKLIEMNSVGQVLLKMGDSYIIEIWANSESASSLSKGFNKVLEFSTNSRILAPVFKVPQKMQRLMNRIGV